MPGSFVGGEGDRRTACCLAALMASGAIRTDITGLCPVRHWVWSQIAPIDKNMPNKDGGTTGEMRIV